MRQLAIRDQMERIQACIGNRTTPNNENIPYIHRKTGRIC